MEPLEVAFLLVGVPQVQGERAQAQQLPEVPRDVDVVELELWDLEN